MIATLARNKNSFNKKKRRNIDLVTNYPATRVEIDFCLNEVLHVYCTDPHQTHKGNGCVLFEIESKIQLLLKTSDLT
jgi:hypothetical protein